MITTLSLNPSIDRTVEVEGFTPGGTNRILTERQMGAGKGVNVAIVARRLGLPVSCLGLIAEHGASAVELRLFADKVPHTFLRSPGAVRTNLKVLDTKTGVMTELNEPGSPVPTPVLEELYGKIQDAAGESAYLVLTGSLPPGCPEDFYARVIRGISGDCRCVLDVDGAFLKAQADAAPYLVKPNQQELEQAAGRKLPTLRDIRTEAFRLLDRGISLVAVSMGGEGALLTDGHTTLFAPSLSVPVYSTVCAGDSMVAGLLYGLSRGGKLHDVLRCGVAAATATVINPKEDLMLPEDFEAFLPKIKVGVV